MTIFVALNGIQIDSAEGIDSLREFFQHERDAELGRWRYPEDTNYVVYGGYSPGEQKRFVRVLNEELGTVSVIYEGKDERSRPHQIAFAYFEAHPERRPWEDAKVGEIWAITIHGNEEPCRVIDPLYSDDTLAFLPVGRPGATWFLPSSSVTDARKLWSPEEAS